MCKARLFAIFLTLMAYVSIGASCYWLEVLFNPSISADSACFVLFLLLTYHWWQSPTDNEAQIKKAWHMIHNFLMLQSFLLIYSGGLFISRIF